MHKRIIIRTVVIRPILYENIVCQRNHYYRVSRAEATVRDVVQKMGTQSYHQSRPDLLPMTVSIDKDHVPSWVIPQEDVELTEREVGRGRWAIVRVANFHGEEVAAKCLTNSSFSEENRKTFMECMEVASQLHHHPNLLPFYGAVMVDKPIILTELLTTNLRAVVEKGKNPLLHYQAVGIALGVANGLEFLHSVKPDPVVHGNLTSTSVLLEKSRGNIWKAKISNFTTAKFFQKLAITNQVSPSITRREVLSSSGGYRVSSPRNTPLSPLHRNRQMSPSEVDSIIKSSRKASLVSTDSLDPLIFTVKRDVYNFGLVLVEICTGTLPVEVSLSFLIESIHWPDLSGLIKECLNYEPESRPSMEIIVSMLTEFSNSTSRP